MSHAKYCLRHVYQEVYLSIVLSREAYLSIVLSQDHSLGRLDHSHKQLLSAGNVLPLHECLVFPCRKKASFSNELTRMPNHEEFMGQGSNIRKMLLRIQFNV